ncbi:AraC family transcriptional regulator [Companilactobacillus hulinensis]|uniref:AraC family transcriptional regulator n=1 Tax=Companilactobacillus hulinensis TaxID=2486007 RepID=UPI000F7881CB|nr:AraC family transcriptional regulator [Companilactobacillus hulinensis]
MEIKQEELDINSSLPFKSYVHQGHGVNVAPHWHQGIEINYLISDNDLEFKENGKTTHYHQGDIWVTNSRVVHEAHLNSENRWLEFGLIVDYSFLKRIYPKIDEIKFEVNNEASLIHPNGYRKLQAHLRDFYQTSLLPTNDANDLRMTGILLLIMSILIEDFIERVPRINDSSNENLVDSVTIQINNRFREPITGFELAEEFNTSLTTLNRQFNKNVQMSVGKYITMIRLLNAQKKLLSSNQTIEYIASDCGFANSKAFIRNFKEWKHITPFRYRKMYK